MEPLTKVRSTSWEEVFADWREREAAWGWPELAFERGFDSWDDWRASRARRYSLERRQWTLYIANQPSLLIPSALAVGYEGWKKYYPNAVRQIRFADLAKNPEVAENPKVRALLGAFPRSTTMIALRHRKEIAIFEGMHRSAAIAVAAEEGRVIAGELTVALTVFRADEGNLFQSAITQRE